MSLSQKPPPACAIFLFLFPRADFTSSFHHLLHDSVLCSPNPFSPISEKQQLAHLLTYRLSSFLLQTSHYKFQTREKNPSHSNPFVTDSLSLHSFADKLKSRGKSKENYSAIVGFQFLVAVISAQKTGFQTRES
jgi:hypothetical protein